MSAFDPSADINRAFQYPCLTSTIPPQTLGAVGCGARRLELLCWPYRIWHSPIHLRRSPRPAALAVQSASRTNPYRGARTWTGRVPQLRSAKRSRPGVTVPHGPNRHRNQPSRNQPKHRRRSLPILRRVRTFERRAKKRQASLVSDLAGGTAHLPLQNACRRENGKAISAPTRASLGDDILVRGMGVRLLAALMPDSTCIQLYELISNPITNRSFVMAGLR